MVNIGNEAGHFFQSDAELAKQREKDKKYNYTAGNAIKISSKVLALKVSQGRKYCYVAESGFTTKKINLETGNPVKVFKGHNGPTTSLALTPDEHTLFTGSWDKTVKQWDVRTGECVRTLTGHTDFVKAILLVGKFLFSGSADAHIRQWDIQTGECVRDLKAHTRSVECLAVSEDGKTLFSASSDRTIRKWDIESGQVLKVYEGHETNVYALTVWDEEMWTASADKTVKRWNIETGESDTTLEHLDAVKSLAIAGSYVVTGSSDDNITVWDIGSSKKLCVIEGHFDEVSCMDIIGSTLYTGSLDCSVRSWPITGQAIKEYAEAPKKKKAEAEPAAADNGLTEEEERELAELLSDDE